MLVCVMSILVISTNEVSPLVGVESTNIVDAALILLNRGIPFNSNLLPCPGCLNVLPAREFPCP